MKNYQRYGSFFCLLFVTLTAACAPVKSLDVWKDENYTQRPLKVLVIALTKKENIRSQFENVFSDQLAKRGVVAIPSYKVLPPLGEKPDREVVLAKVRELGIDHVFVSRSVDKKEITNHQYGGVLYGATAIYDNGWYTYYSGYSYNREYDTEYFALATNLFNVESKKPVWSDLSQIKVEGSREGAVNVFVPVLIKQLEESQIIEKIAP